MQKEIYPIFQECKKYTLDPYYQDLLIHCSQGRFPKGIRMIGTDNLLLNAGGEKKLYNLPLDDVKQSWIIILGIFREKLHLHSDEEFILDPEKINESKKRNLSMIRASEWKDLKGKKIKDQLLLDYVKSLKSELNLPISDARRLDKLVNLHFNILRDITGDDIVFKHGKIIDIIPLEIVKEDDRIIFNFNCKNAQKVERTSTSSANKNFSLVVKRYLKSLSENYVTLN